METIGELSALAARHFQGGDLQQAEMLCRRILQADPAHTAALQMLGLLALQTGNHEAAGALVRRAIALSPADPGSHFNLGLILKGQGRVADATECFRQAVRLNPRFVDGFNNLGLVLKEQGETGEAVERFRQALRINPGHAAVVFNLGNILMEQGELAEAALCFRKAISTNPQYVGAHNNLGCVLLDQGRREEASACFAEALRLKPGHAPTLWNRSRLRLLRADFPEAWADFEYRWEKPDIVRSHQDRPRWDGSPLGAKTILLYPEQGLGDTIHFIRYAALVKQRGGKVVFECPPVLARLLTGVAGIDQFVRAGTTPPPFDVQAPLLSLPDIFGTTLATIPAAVPYLHAHPSLVEHWKKELAPLGGFKIGIAWQGNSQHLGDRYRSFPLMHFEPLARVEGVRLVSLQKGQGTEQLRGQFPILDMGDRLDVAGAFLDTAAVMLNLDLVITADSAVAHLAGALAVPVWVPLSVAPDWRWLLERADSPWYPTMRLFRQQRFGEWGPVFERIATEVRAAVHPTNTDCHFNLGNALKDQGHLAEAAACYRRALHGNPRNAAAHNNLGVALRAQGKLAEAIACYRQALGVDPLLADTHFNLGIALGEQEQLVEALACYRQALRINPEHVAAHHNLGCALNDLGILLKEQGRLDEAGGCFREALGIDPRFANAHHNLGGLLNVLGNLAEAVECFRQALRINPHLAPAHTSLGLTLMQMGLFSQALEHHEEALRIDPGNGRALWNRSLLRLLQGDFTAGWKDYEERLTILDKNPRSFQQPRWDGSSLAGKTILVHAEQGLGDTIQFVRYLYLVKERGGTVLFECQPALARLCSGVAGVDRIIVRGAALPPCDVQVALLSLPGIFGTTPATIPAGVPYLRADSGRTQHWRRELESLAGFKIGIAWQGNPRNTKDCTRSLPLLQFEALANMEGVSLLSLQVGPGAEQLAAATFSISDLGTRFDTSSLEDLAAVLMNLDLVITVDTAVAHLAGALGVRVWTLLTLTPDWRWLLERADSPWYPTMRLFRQRRFGDWRDVLERVKEELHSCTWPAGPAPSN